MKAKYHLLLVAFNIATLALNIWIGNWFITPFPVAGIAISSFGFLWVNLEAKSA
jgi:hypothetical protein